MPFSTTNARARFARVPTIAFALSLFAVLLAPLSAFAAAPKISGTPKVGPPSRRAPGPRGPAGVVLRCQRYADSTAIKGQTGKSLKLTKAQAEKRIRPR